jgi:hypothetical protein
MYLSHSKALKHRAIGKHVLCPTQAGFLRQCSFLPPSCEWNLAQASRLLRHTPYRKGGVGSNGRYKCLSLVGLFSA